MSEFHGSDSLPSYAVKYKIYKNFMIPLEEARLQYGRPIKISNKSGYRSAVHELAYNRLYISEHQFINKGAVDLVADRDLVYLLFKMRLFPRLIWYRHRNFVHVDYKNSGKGSCALYLMQPDEKNMSIMGFI